MVTKEQIIVILEKLLPRDKISGVVINGGHIGFALLANDEVLRKACEKAVFALSGVEIVTAVLTGEKGEIKISAKNTPVLNRRQPIPGVSKVIMVASGKGGVGKSTIAVNLAVAAAQLGKKVGLVDADIYGPSVPRMLGLLKPANEMGLAVDLKPEMIDGKMIPFKAHGVLCNSVGFLLDENDAAIWRGPMAAKALHQLMLGTRWAASEAEGLDLLFIDMPPGTGDIQLSLAQNYKIDGAILVSTPQEVAVADVRRAAKMFLRTEIPIIGLVQNMSFFEFDNVRQFIFGENGAKKFAEQNAIKFLGDIPLQQLLRENSDNGVVQPSSEFVKITTNVLDWLG